MKRQPTSDQARHPVSHALERARRVSLDLSNVPPGPGHRRAALAVAALSILAVVGVLPFGGMLTGVGAPWVPVVPAIIAVVFGGCWVSAYLLWRQFAATGKVAVGFLGFVYYLVGLVALVRILTFPLPSAIANGQSGPWNWLVWHGIFPLLLGVTVFIGYRRRIRPARTTFWMRLGLVAGLGIVALMAVVVRFSEGWPPLVVGDYQFSPLFVNVARVEWVFAAAVTAAFLVRERLRGKIQLWLAVVMLSYLADLTVVIAFPERTSFGYWVGFGETLIAATAMAFMLLHESGRQHEVIEDQRAWLTSVVDNVADALLTFGPSRTITWCNPAAARMFRTDPESIIGCPVRDWFPGFEGFERTKGETESIGRRADGGTFPIEVSSSVLIADGETTTILIARDITERKRVEVALARARDQAVTAARAKADFLATMSHEIRTPINAIVGMTELLMETPMSEQQREYGRTVQNSADALLSIIDDILDISKLEAGKLELETVPFDLLAVIEAAADIVAAQARKKDLAVISFVEPSVPRQLMGDPNRLRQVLLNLLSNAVKFTEQGHVIVRAILVQDRGDSARLKFEIEDTGIGIAAEAQERLFSPFEQADQSTSRRYGGTGLGLSISRRLVALMHGGEMGLTSREGEGSTFWFEVEFLRAPHGMEVPAPQRLAGMKVLVVDDDASSRTILQEYLRAWGVEVEAVGDAKSALVTLISASASRRPFDVALIDYRMPESDGLSLGVAIGSDPYLKKTRTVLITAFDDIGRGREAVASGFSHYLRKPVRQSILYNALTQTLPAVPREEKAEPVASDEGNGRPSKILLVEDHEINRTMTLRQLERLGFGADVAANGREAVEASEDAEYALVIMDVQMPEMDGFEATRRIRRREATSGLHVPIIAMTANAMEGDRESCLAAGMDDYVAKPVRLDDLRRVLELYVGAALR